MPWNNGKEVPRWGVAEIQKMSPSTTGRCSRQTADQWERGTATRQPITQICSPGVVELVRTNLAPDFPLFHVLGLPSADADHGISTNGSGRKI